MNYGPCAISRYLTALTHRIADSNAERTSCKVQIGTGRPAVDMSVSAVVPVGI